MIVIQSHSKIDSITLFFDSEGIDEMISYLNFIKSKDVSFHLNSGNELEESAFDEDLFIVPHAKIINVDMLDKA